MVSTLAWIEVVIRSTTSAVFCSCGGNSGKEVVAATVSVRPSGTAHSARIRSATVSLPARAKSTSSSSWR